MNHTPLHKFFIFNGELRPNARFKTSENSGGVYEVLRVVEGIPLFLEEHLDRFYFSAGLAGKKITFSPDQITAFLDLLIQENGILEGNILMSCKANLKVLFIRHNYPNPFLYEEGVCCSLLHAERSQPNAKVFQSPVRQQADALIEKEGCFEVLLIDHLGRITEGSRSNIFFVTDNQLITPPGDEVLLGITRQKAIQIASHSGITCREEEVWLKDIHRSQAAFITGTSPKILPLSRIGEWRMNPRHSLVQRMRKKYDEIIVDYIRSHKEKGGD